MNFIKAGHIAIALLTFTSATALAQSAEGLSGYTPPPMFGAAPPAVAKTAQPPTTTNKADSFPVTPAPPIVEQPRTEPASPKKEFYKIVTPPNDKEKVLQDEPLPIETIRRGTPQKPTTVPDDKDKIPAYVPPVKKAPEKTSVTPVEDKKVGEQISLPIPKQDDAPSSKTVMPATKLAPAPNVRNVAPATMKAEDLLSHPVTSQSDVPMANPMAVPAAPVENGLPLPGSVPPKPKKEAPKKSDPVKKDPPAKIADKKKPEKKTEAKKDKKTPVKKEEKKETVKKPVEKKVEAKKEAKKPEPKPIVNANKSFHLEGKKNMPTIKPTKVEKETLPGSKPPLPDPTNIKPIAPPTINEQVIDNALVKHMVDPDVKTIEKSAPPTTKAAPDKNAKKDSVKKPVTGTVGGPSADQVATDLIGLGYKGDATDLVADQKTVLDSSVIPKLVDKGTSVQILAFSSPTKDSVSGARRISLNRGLAIRDYLMQKGIAPDRIIIKALGENSKEKPLDRADLLVIPAK